MNKKLKKIAIISLVALFVFLAGGFGAYKGYKHVRQVRLVKQAREQMEQAEPNHRKAMLYLQRALRHNNRDVEAARLMAQLLELSRSPGALLWRNRVVELNPNSNDDRIALAQTALLFRDISAATNALQGVSDEGRKTAGYHSIAGMVAVAVNQVQAAEQHFNEAARLEPHNASPRLNLAVLHLQSTNNTLHANARTALDQISTTSTNASLRSQALRELIADSLRRKNPKEALAISGKLLQQTNAVFRDKIIRLEVLQETRSTDYKSALKAFQDEAATDPGKAHELAIWQMANASPAEVLNWLHALPVSIKTNATIMLTRAECQDRAQNWKALQTDIEKQTWGDLDFLRHAYLARAQRGQQLAAAAKGEWELALKGAINQKSSLQMLLRTTALWKWQNEAEEILWTIVNRFPEEKWAAQTLTQALYSSGRTRPLMMLSSQQLKRSPENLALKNNLAATALLLDAKELKPHDLAREVYQASPTNAAYLSTYAFSLYIQQKNGEALKLMQTLRPEQLSDPAIAGYYGLILRATGEKNKARSYIDWAFKAPMLPEEKKLFEQAKFGI